MFDHRFVLFSGKGGVGKTTVSSAFALSCAQRGQRTLLVQLDAKEKVSSFFGSHQVSTDIIEVEENLFAVNITPSAALEEYGLMILKLKFIYRAVFENRIVQTFLRTIPGLNDLLMLGKAHYHSTQRNQDGSPVWDKVVVDAPATGHGIFFLQIPSVITSSLSSGRMYEEAKRIEAFLRDPTQTSFNLVALPEEMPVNETLMLEDVVRDKLGINVHSVIANAVYPGKFSGQEVEWIHRELQDAPDDETVRGLLDAASFREKRVRLHRTYLSRLQKETGGHFMTLPHYFEQRITFPVIRDMAQRLTQQICGDGGDNHA